MPKKHVMPFKVGRLKEWNTKGGFAESSLVTTVPGEGVLAPNAKPKERNFSLPMGSFIDFTVVYKAHNIVVFKSQKSNQRAGG